MREIKFRAWDERLNKMMIVNQIQWYATDGFYSHVNGINCYLHKDIIIMQYTGLKDKNGKEIYEGDIVKFRPYAGATDEYIGEIKWMNILSAFRVIKKSKPKFNNAPETVWKIIGNIYENPELIKKEK